MAGVGSARSEPAVEILVIGPACGKTDEARAAINARVQSIKTFGGVQDYHKHVQALRAEKRAKTRIQP